MVNFAGDGTSGFWIFFSPKDVRGRGGRSFAASAMSVMLKFAQATNRNKTFGKAFASWDVTVR